MAAGDAGPGQPSHHIAQAAHLMKMMMKVIGERWHSGGGPPWPGARCPSSTLTVLYYKSLGANEWWAGGGKHSALGTRLPQRAWLVGGAGGREVRAYTQPRAARVRAAPAACAVTSGLWHHRPRLPRGTLGDA